MSVAIFVTCLVNIRSVCVRMMHLTSCLRFVWFYLAVCKHDNKHSGRPCVLAGSLSSARDDSWKINDDSIDKNEMSFKRITCRVRTCVCKFKNAPN